MSTPINAVANLWQASVAHTDALIRLDDELSAHWMAIIANPRTCSTTKEFNNV